MKYTIYQITNLIDGKIYIGKHQTSNIEDNYMGSGKLLKRAQSKYGLENFKKEILYIFDSEDDMNNKEAELVTEEFCLREDTYNICPGGQGGFSYINNNGLCGLNIPGVPLKGRKATDKILEQKYGSDWRSVSCSNAREGLKRILEKDPNYLKDRATKSFQGKQHTDKSKLIISQKAKERLKDSQKNSQFGTMWITNGFQNKKIKTFETIPEGWYKGRKLKI